MKNLFLVYRTDSQHSFASRDIIGIASTVGWVIRLCREQAKKEGAKISNDQLFNLKNIKQTQGYSGVGEFHYELVTKNTLL